MTVLDEAVDLGIVRDDEQLPTSVGDDTPARSRRSRREALRQAAIRVGIVALAIVLIVLVFEHPVASTWYHARQEQLASDFTVNRAHAVPGQATVLLQVPRLDLNVVVIEGDGPSELRSGPGHRPGTPLPGKKGNCVILGHRDAWGGPFADLEELHRGNRIVAQAHGGPSVVYVVRSVRRAAADDLGLLAPSTDHRLTLVTSAGGMLSDERLIVSAVSGTVGRLGPAGRAKPAPSADLFGAAANLGLGLLAFLVAAMAISYLRRRKYHAIALVVVGGPLLLAGMLGVLLCADGLLPAVR